ncbi:MAG: response regulator [Chloroflexota bacterium]|nr:MAG: response regulator [Chloroflexota bacterium]
MTERPFKSSVLVVDDEPGIVRLCLRLLERAGFRVMAVTNPNEGVAILEKEQFDLLLADIRMPEMDGFNLIDLARRHRPDLAVVVMTGYGTVETAIEALRRGADGLILKPFAGAELVQSVQRALQERQHKQDVLRLQTLRPLFAITESLYAETDPERLKELLLDTICGHLHCTYAGLYPRQMSERNFYLVAGRGDLPAEEEANPERSLVARADALGAALVARSEGAGEPGIQALLAWRGLGSAMVAPLRAPAVLKEGGSVLMAARSQGEAALRESELEIFAILARHAAVALENARLHSELRAYIRQVEESQRALIQAEKMAIAGRLTVSIAHEINNPLQSVQNCMHLAGRKELSPEERQNYLELAQSELERLMHTVQRMLEYYRPGAVDRKALNINDLVQRVLRLTERQLEDRGVVLKTKYAASIPAVMVVSDQIQQVLLNLILNAMEAMQGGGRLNVETRGRHSQVEVLIEDNGPGISPAQREHLFEPFVSTKEGGTGLGLAVSYGIIAAHGGSLELLDGRGHGACFRISLPTGA